jgi:hypothetical protein
LRLAGAHLGVLLGASACGAWALIAACSSSANPDGPQCANESTAVPFSDAGILPLRALPTGRPCAESAVCGATIDDCANDWPVGAAAPLTSNATPYQCTCPSGVWSCVATTSTAPSCSIASDAGPTDAGTDAGPIDGGAD